MLTTTCPAWCTADHTNDPPDLHGVALEHHTRGSTP